MKNQILIFFAIICFLSCKKQEEWLDKKSNKADVVPVTLKDFQALMDNTDVITEGHPSIGMTGSDNGYVTDAVYQTLTGVSDKAAYIWASDIYEGSTQLSTTTDWVYPYQVVEYCNVALDGLSKIEQTAANKSEWENIKGSALFYRSMAFYELAQIYAKPYDRNSAASDLGIPIRLESDINVRSVRTTIQQTYEQILNDLQSAYEMLPITPLYKTRPGKPAVNALLSKVYLNMGDYQNALVYADKTLIQVSALLNFNSVSPTPAYPFPTYQVGNPEIILHSGMVGYGSQNINNQLVEESLYNLYSLNDLRRSLFFRINANGTKSFRGRYVGSPGHFGGIATNQIYLIKAEAQARTGKIPESMSTLNSLLATRFTTGTYVPYSASNETDALNIILRERNKELPFTGNIRWEDLRRLNKDPRFAKTLNRTVNGKVYTLPPNDPRYVLPIIPLEISLYGLEQNIR